MNCEKHTENSAVGQCSECGAGVCKKCANVTSVVREYFGTLCLDCYEEHIEIALSNTKEELKKITRRIKGKLFFYVVGLICLAIGGVMLLAQNAGILEATSPTRSEVYQGFLVSGLCFCGIYSAISGWKLGSESHEKSEEMLGTTYNVYDDGTVSRDQGWGIKIFGFILGLVFGVVATPLSLITDSNKKREEQQKIIMFEEELEKLSDL